MINISRRIALYRVCFNACVSLNLVASRNSMTATFHELRGSKVIK